VYRSRFVKWIKPLHEYIISRLKVLESNMRVTAPTTLTNALKGHKLVFYSDNGIADYRGARWSFIGKSRAILDFFNKSKNTPYGIDEIIKGSNAVIVKKKNIFKSEKDIYDCLRLIRFHLKVNKGEYFPIHKTENCWIWQDK